MFSPALQTLTHWLDGLMAEAGGVSVVAPPSSFHRCPLSQWWPVYRRSPHAFWRISLPQRHFCTFPLCMVHINAP